MQPLISVIIPIYNVEHYLRQCVDSILYQTYTNLEIILVDDESPDTSPAICDEYAQKDKRIKVIHKENGGLSSARNAGLDIAEGEYIYFLDSDDYIGENTINNLYQYFNENKKIVIVIGYFTALIGDCSKTYNESWIFDKPRSIDSNDFAIRMLTEKSNHAATAKLYRKEIFKNIRFQVGKKNEDTLFEADLIPIIESNNYKCIDVPIYTYYYRLHDESICRSKTDPFEWYIIENCENIISKFKERIPIVHFLRNRQLDLMIPSLSNYIKQDEKELLRTKHKYIKAFPNSFVVKNKSFKVILYFFALKYTPNILILRNRIKLFFRKHNAT